MSTNYSILVDVQLDLSDIQSQLSKQKYDLNMNSSDVKEASTNVKDLGTKVEDTTKKTGEMNLTFQAANAIFRTSINIISSVVDRVFELDAAMIEFKKVSDLSGDSLDAYSQKLGDMGQNVARTQTEMYEAATEFRKNSFSDEDSAVLAEVAGVFQNVADEAITASDSASVLIAMMKAFNVEAEDTISIVDQINEVANNFAVSSSDISTALPKVSATLAQAGNTMSESIGLLTAATELMPGNASRVARGLRTITLSLQGLNDEGEESYELVASLAPEFDKLGISLFGLDGQMRSSYDILSELHGVWGDLDKNTQSYLAETIAGTTQVDVFNSLMSNFTSAIGANEAAMDSAGSAMRENEAYMSGLESKLNLLSASFEQFSTQLISSDLVGWVLDLANAFLQFASTDFGSTITALTLLLATLGSGYSLIKLIGGAILADLIPLLTVALPTAFGFTTTSVVPTTAAFGALGATTTTTTVAVAAFYTTLLWGVAIIAAVAGGAYLFKKAWDDANPSFADATTKLNELNSELKTTNSRIEELESVSDTELTFVEQQELADLKEANALLKEQIALQNTIREDAWKGEKTSSDYITGYDLHYEVPVGEMYKAVDSLVELQEKGFSVFQSAGFDYMTIMVDSAEELAEAMEILGTSAGQAGTRIVETFGAFSNEEFLARSIEKLKDFGKKSEYGADELNEFATAQKFVNGYVDSFGGALEDASAEVKENVKIIQDLNTQYNDSVAVLKRETDGFAALSGKMYLTSTEAEELQKTNKDLVISTDATTGALYLEAGAFEKLVKAGDTWALSVVEQQKVATQATVTAARQRIAALQAEMAAIEAAYIAQHGYTNLSAPGQLERLMDAVEAEMAGPRAELAEALQFLSDLEKLTTSTANITTPTDPTDPSDTGTSTTEDLLAELKELLALTQFKIDANEQIGGMEAEMIADYEKMIRKIVEKREELSALGYTQKSDEIQELYRLEWGYLDEIQKLQESIDADFLASQQAKWDAYLKLREAALEKEKALLEEQLAAIQGIYDKYDAEKDAYLILSDFMVEYIQDEIDALQDKIDALDAVNEELEEQIEYEEKLDALARAKQTNLLVFKDGKFQYVNDIDAVAEAQGELDDYEREKELEDQKKALEEQQDIYKQYQDEWSDLTKAYTDEQKAKLLEQALGIKAEKENFATMLANAQDFATKYTAVMGIITSASEALALTQGKIDDIDAQLDLNNTDDIFAQMKANSDAWHEATTDEERLELEEANKELASYVGMTQSENFDTDTGRWDGVDYSDDGISLASDDDIPIAMMSTGTTVTTPFSDQVMASDVVKDYTIEPANNTTNTTNITVGEVILPDVNDPKEFATAITNNMMNRTLQTEMS